MAFEVAICDLKQLRNPENLPELVSKAGGAVLGPPLNRPTLGLHA